VKNRASGVGDTTAPQTLETIMPAETDGRSRRAIRRIGGHAAERAVAFGAPPSWFGWRRIRRETLREYFDRDGPGAFDVLHGLERSFNPLPCNILDVSALSDDPGWFGFSMRDVPSRFSGETILATIPDCTVITFTDSPQKRFWPAIVNRDHRALHLREIDFRSGHGRALRAGNAPVRLAEATWIAERVYDNHSHWLTAHLPKLCLLKSRGELDNLVLPPKRTPVIDASLSMLGLNPTDFGTYDPERPLQVDRLTILETDRFRPQLLRPVRKALAVLPDQRPWRRVFISRAQAPTRKLANESELEPVLAEAGFETVIMEKLSFEEQIRLMGQTDILMAPHGAGLTNMMFCAPGTHVVEIAEPRYPNPNFYALACAMNLAYWYVEAHFSGGENLRLLDRDLRVDPHAVKAILRQIGT
jgi:hypothetical protein